MSVSSFLVKHNVNLDEMDESFVEFDMLIRSNFSVHILTESKHADSLH